MNLSRKEANNDDRRLDLYDGSSWICDDSFCLVLLQSSDLRNGRLTPASESIHKSKNEDAGLREY